MPANVLDPSSAVAISTQEDFVREFRDGEGVLTAALPVVAPAARRGWSQPRCRRGRRGDAGGPRFPPAWCSGRGSTPDSKATSAASTDPTLTLDVDLGGREVMPAIVAHPTSALLDPAELERTGTSPADAAVQIVAQLVTTRQRARRRGSVVTPSSPVPGTIPTPASPLPSAATQPAFPGCGLAPLSAVPSTTDPVLMATTDRRPWCCRRPPDPGLEARSQRIDLTRVAAAATARCS